MKATARPKNQMLLLAALLLCCSSLAALADGTETLGLIAIADGTDIVGNGIGLAEGAATMTVKVPADTTVEQVLLYWNGFHSTSDNAVDKLIIEVDGGGQMAIDGTLIGGPTLFFGTSWSSTYRADITGLGLIAAPGDFDVEVTPFGAGFDRANNGASLLIVVNDPNRMTNIQLADGQDLAYRRFAPPLDKTVPQVFDFPPADQDRFMTLSLLAGSVQGPVSGDLPVRPNIVDVTVDGVRTRFEYPFASFNGDEWDHVCNSPFACPQVVSPKLDVTIPANVGQLTIEAISSGFCSNDVTRACLLDSICDGPGVCLIDAPNEPKPASFVWMATALSIREPTCGDGIIDPGEFCDDGNDVDDDACRNDCTYCGDGEVNDGETCDDGNDVDDDDCRNDCTYCGDGVSNGGETCDDGNDINDDACRNDCTYCGDGVQDAGEFCDDGNGIDDDDCRNDCTYCGDGVVNDGETCDDGNDVDDDDCRNDCTYCGDGVSNGGETCDDGNNVDDDDCRNDCTYCGDGVQDAGEFCDDGNDVDDDDCRNDCTYCGDGEVNDGETCDDGNDVDDDDCRNDCTYCGDGVQDAGEFCDDGNDVEDDDCRNDCTYCGDGEVNDGETCDDGNDVDDDDCRNDCTYCGDGVQDAGEFCDDGNDVDDDDCRNDCTYCGDGVVNDGETCDDGNDVDDDDCRNDCTYCGDGVQDAGEFCDDGNDVDDDDCRNDCTYCGDGEVNDGETCDDGNDVDDDDCRNDCTYCGDGVQDAGEFCDDGNDVDDDDCRNDCTYCGDGVVNDGETCDDGNDVDDDDCRNDCTYCGDGVQDAGEFCDDGNDVDDDDCRNDCTYCGDGVVNDGETCDDGNDVDDDDCRNDCTYCGDGVVNDGEECDDGNDVNDDDCRNDCTYCGDGVVNDGETCDDGNDIDDDDCRNDCTYCGDGVQDAGEFCDDGNDVDDDDCRNDCTYCGDGVVNDGETCDDGNDIDDDDCRNDCTYCGDGVQDAGEFCDDGNDVDDDDCRNDCTYCGDGEVNDGEECDDGNDVNDDDCNNECMRRCEAQLDKQISCDGGTTYVDTGFGDNVASTCIGWDGDDEVKVRYVVDTEANGSLYNCQLIDSNGLVLGAPVDIGTLSGNLDEFVIWETSGIECSEQLELAEPDTATLACECYSAGSGVTVMASDQANIECQAVALEVTKECGNQDPDTDLSPVSITVSNPANPRGASLRHCEVIDELANFLSDPFDLAPGESRDFDVSVSGLTSPTLNIAWVHCDIVGAAGKRIVADEFDLCRVCPDITLDKQVSCDGGTTYADVGDDNGAVETCMGREGENDILVRYVANGMVNGYHSDCMLVDSNGEILANPRQMFGFPGAVFETRRKDCTAELEAGEPNTATLTCECYVPGSGLFVSAMDEANIECIAPKCDDDIVDEADGETCDPPGDPAGASGNDCREDCTVCGDGVLDSMETCDDGNNVDDDGCRNDCTFCGDGELDPTEECDDGNNDPGDGCSPDCVVEQLCELEVVKTCIVPEIADGDDDDDDDDNDCLGRVLSMKLQYTGDGCSATTNDQSGQVSCLGDAAGVQPVSILVTDRRGNEVYADEDGVFLGDVVEASNTDPQTGEPIRIGPNTVVAIDGGTETVQFHTSCSQPLAVGDQFGSMLLVEMTTTQGGTVTLPPSPDPSDGTTDPSTETSECTIPATPPGPHCEGKVQALGLRYVGGDCLQSDNDQGDKDYCDGTAGAADPIRIRCFKDSKGYLDTGDANVAIGDVVIASAGNAGDTELGSETRCEIYDDGGSWLQDLRLHTSCSQPLNLGDRFGSLEVFSMDTSGGGMVSQATEVLYRYRITNHSVVAAENVTAVDSELGELPGSPVASIAPDETVLLEATALISETTTNTVTVNATLETGEVCDAVEDTATVTVDEPPVLQECTTKIDAMLLQYIGPDIAGPVTVAVLPRTQASPVVYEFPGGLAGGTIVSSDAQNGFTVDPGVQGQDDAGSKTSIFINGSEEVHHTSCSTPYVSGLPAPLDNPKGDPSPNWFVINFTQK